VSVLTNNENEKSPCSDARAFFLQLNLTSLTLGGSQVFTPHL